MAKRLTKFNVTAAVRVLFLLLLLLTQSKLPRGVCDETVDPPDGEAELGQFLHKAMLAAAESCKSGVYKGTETTSDEPVGGPATKQRADYYGAFDFTSGKIRFDYRSESNHDRNYHYIESPESTVVYSEATSYKIFRGPREPGKSPAREFFDVRCLGILTLNEVKSGLLSGEFRAKFDEEAKNVSGHKTENSSHYELLNVSHKGIVQTRFTLDADKLYLPSRLERHYLDHPIKASKKYAETVTVEWQHIGDSWVPLNVVMNFDSDRGRKSRQLSFEWESVNQGVPDVAFDHNQWKLAAGTRVVDSITNPEKPILLEVIGE